MSDYFPVDVLTDILSRLPVKTLVISSCVCKLWRDIIVDTVFIARHASKSHLHRHHQQKFLFLQEYPIEIDCSPAAEVEFIEWPYENIRRYQQTTDSWYPVLGFCKGLILLSGSVLALVNPSLHRFMVLPPIKASINNFGGIGFDSVSNDYKVLFFHYPRTNEGEPLVISLYSLNKNSWEDITAKSRYSYRMLPCQDSRKLLFMNGYLHLIAYSKPNPYRDFPDILSRFDVTNEVFDTMCFPEIEYCSDNLGTCSIASVFGKFSLGISGFTVFSIWVMNEYNVKESWTRQFRVDISAFGGCLLGSHGNGELLFDVPVEGAFSYDLKINEGRCLGVPISVFSLYVDKLEESLALFNHRIPTRETPTSFKPLNPCVSKKRKDDGKCATSIPIRKTIKSVDTADADQE